MLLTPVVSRRGACSQHSEPLLLRLLKSPFIAPLVPVHQSSVRLSLSMRVVSSCPFPAHVIPVPTLCWPVHARDAPSWLRLSESVMHACPSRIIQAVELSVCPCLGLLRPIQAMSVCLSVTCRLCCLSVSVRVCHAPSGLCLSNSSSEPYNMSESVSVLAMKPSLQYVEQQLKMNGTFLTPKILETGRMTRSPGP